MRSLIEIVPNEINRKVVRGGGKGGGLQHRKEVYSWWREGC